MKYLLICFMGLSSFAFAQDISVMSYNIKLDYPKDGVNSWANRKPFFIKQLKFYEPDIIGVQEAMPNQMKAMDSLLVDYSYVGVGRDDGADAGEYSALFYKTQKFEILKSGTFWLSETPDEVSRGWDAVCHRICTYALLKDKASAKTFWLFNTHFDHVGELARTNSAVLILEKIKAFNIEDVPVVLTGDFNMEPDHPSIHRIMEDLNDSKQIAKLSFGPEGTFNGFHFNKPVTRRIDFVFVSKEVEVPKYAALSDNWNLQYPSDHLPILITLRLK
ncbi:endonuclease/exonuclease/phosphatase family protein [Winogradskyella arenosi]|uniref:Endonuclease/exonuclease/phosphatase family metal-dependent hydrolase n=1 Tax=Winogradskyella arenosi TaxID=533325 RepID=A0A368ZBT3_9FLAO|nr:endonuclease/exonuclease/phosphatase family protein [Winogradskyella arenosi]RCW90328.1 endonuclease/exonuclease/phosphatase family metal-dependent hydrolase [Winogradskyella arenosi]